MEECKPLGGGAGEGESGSDVQLHGSKQGKAVQVEPMEFKLKAPGSERLKQVKAPGSERLKPKYDNLFSRFGFKCNLRRYTKEFDAKLHAAEMKLEAWAYTRPLSSST